MLTPADEASIVSKGRVEVFEMLYVIPTFNWNYFRQALIVQALIFAFTLYDNVRSSGWLAWNYARSLVIMQAGASALGVTFFGSLLFAVIYLVRYDISYDPFRKKQLGALLVSCALWGASYCLSVIALIIWYYEDGVSQEGGPFSLVVAVAGFILISYLAWWQEPWFRGQQPRRLRELADYAARLGAKLKRPEARPYCELQRQKGGFHAHRILKDSNPGSVRLLTYDRRNDKRQE